MKTLEEAKSEFLQLISDLNSSQEIGAFIEWIKNEASDEIIGSCGTDSIERIEKRRNLSQIADFTKSLMPNFEAVCNSETIKEPSNCSEGLNFQNTAHVDAFLYDEADVEELTNEGKIPTHFCKNCGSKNVTEIELLTHSCARDDVEFIFEALLPDLSGKVVLDVGSRIGAVLYGAYMFSNCPQIIGVEMNTELCKIAHGTIQQFRMQDRIQIINAELSTRFDLVQNADVIVLNNVFDWFVPIDIQIKLWQFIRQNVKKGALLVTIPSLEEALEKLPGNAGLELSNWIKSCSPFRPSRLPSKEVTEKCETIKLYIVQ